MEVIQLSHTMNEDSRKLLLCEIIKFIIYQRGQTPLPVDVLMKEVKKTVKDKDGKSQSSSQRSHSMAATALSNALEAIRTSVASANQPAYQLAVLLGATPVTPKEIYTFLLPVYVLEKPCCGESSSVVTREVFRSLITHDLIGENPLIPTNTYVMLQSPRHSPPPGFLPKPSYRLPRRGKHFEFELLDNCHKEKGHDLTAVSYCDMDISGVETLAGDMCAFTPPPFFHSPISPDEDVIWFQSPVCVKGFK